ncbi:FHA domain-containing protein [Planobispora takensis]|uniref:FHA domain-containing protein n=1 Tax=Planobispora takensis TaxID=1367882 RepID=A0A8J3SUU2_9ACTN|nr:FHA domain-containing protein [Planobispora takensis]GII00036.1 hypothetical protein Pta02_20440 [Planobispora takensis]
MTDQGFGVVRPLPGNGLVAHVGGLLLVCDAAEAVAEDLLGAVRETAASGGDGRALARRVAQVLAAMMGEPVACAVAGHVPEGVAVLVSGQASASVTGSGGEVHLAGRDALTWSDRLVPGPVTRVELRLPDAGSAHRFARLDGGVISGGGVQWDPSETGEAAQPPMRAAQPAPAPVQAPPMPSMGAGPGPAPGPSMAPDWGPPPMEPAGPPMEQRPGPVMEPAPAGPPPYPLGPADPYPPAGPPMEQQAPAPQGWHSEPMPAAPSQGPGSGPAPAVPSHEDVDTARANGMGGDPIDVHNESFEYELLTPGAPGPSGTAPDMPMMPEPEARPLVYGVDCKNDHFNDPRVPYCAVCGIALVQRTLVPYKGPRPPLGVLLLDDGMTLRLDTDYLLGRDPERAPEVAEGAVRPAKVTSPDGSVSRRHLRVALDGWDVNLVDLGSVNGTQIQPPGDPNFYDIPPNEPVTIAPGTTVRIGVSRTMRYESHRNN